MVKVKIEKGEDLGEIRFKYSPVWNFLATDLLGRQDPREHKLYKQIEIKGQVTATNPEMQKRLGDAVLVLKGTGNACTHNFEQWHLIIDSEDAEGGLNGHGFFLTHLI